MRSHIKIVSTLSKIVENKYFISAMNSGKNPEHFRKGGYLTIFLTNAEPCDPPITTTLIGLISPRLIRATYVSSREQGSRLLMYRKHKSSFQSRDSERGLFGGAIRIPQFIISFAGFDELENEALLCTLAFHLNLETKETLLKILKLSESKLAFERVDRAVRGVGIFGIIGA